MLPATPRQPAAAPRQWVCSKARLKMWNWSGSRCQRRPSAQLQGMQDRQDDSVRKQKTKLPPRPSQCSATHMKWNGINEKASAYAFARTRSTSTAATHLQKLKAQLQCQCLNHNELCYMTTLLPLCCEHTNITLLQ